MHRKATNRRPGFGTNVILGSYRGGRPQAQHGIATNLGTRINEAATFAQVVERANQIKPTA
jgi:hypothetical protein